MLNKQKSPTKQGSASFWTVPNILTLYRLLVFPFILYLILIGNEFLFSIFITISLITDILDGFIARRFNLESEIGARLDSIADTGTYILAFLAVYFFKWEEFAQHLYGLLLFLFVLVASYAVVLLKFKGLIGLHTYLFKITGYLQGTFIVILFLSGFYSWLYYIAIFFGTAACIEEIIIILMLTEPRTNVKGLYWVIKNGKK